MDTEASERERRLRRAAHTRGYRLVRLHQATRRTKYSGYLLIDAERDLVVLGGDPEPFSAKFDDVENFLMDGAKPRGRRRLTPPE